MRARGLEGEKERGRKGERGKDRRREVLRRRENDGDIVCVCEREGVG
jgi:hypothetical protein